MSQSEVDLCNSALTRVGASTIMSLLDNSKEARLCSIAYDSNRRSELRSYIWKFAIKRAVIASDTSIPLFEYSYAFRTPTDCLRILPPPDACCDWNLEGDTILTNYPNNGTALNIRYIADITDLTLFDSMCYDVVSLALASDICEALTQSPSKKQVIDQEYVKAVNLARHVGALETRPLVNEDTGWLLSRL